MSFRSILAGPSHLAMRLPSAPTSVTSVRHLRIPHPDTILPPGVTGSNKFTVKTMNKIPNMVYAFAIVRAVEKELGTSVISITVDRDIDIYKPRYHIYIETLRPVEFTKPLLRSIPPPKITHNDIYGGPSLEDVQNALKNVSTISPFEGEGTKGGDVQFKIEITEAATRIQTPKTKFSNKWTSITQARRDAERAEALLDTLAEMEDERFTSIAKKWSKLRRDDPGYTGPNVLRPRPEQHRSTGAGIGAEEEGGELGEDTVTGILNGAQGTRNQRKTQDGDAEDGELGTTEGGEGNSGYSQVRSQLAELRKKKQLEREANGEHLEPTPPVPEKPKLPDWRFVPGSGSTYQSTIDLGSTAPSHGRTQGSEGQQEGVRPQRFSLRSIRPTPEKAAESVASPESSVTALENKSQRTTKEKNVAGEKRSKAKKEADDKAEKMRQALAGIRELREAREGRELVGAQETAYTEPEEVVGTSSGVEGEEGQSPVESVVERPTSGQVAAPVASEPEAQEEQSTTGQPAASEASEQNTGKADGGEEKKDLFSKLFGR